MRKAKLPTLFLFTFAMCFTFSSCNNSDANKQLDGNLGEPNRENKHYFEVQYSTPWLDISIHDGRISQISTDHHFSLDNYKDMPDSIFTNDDLDEVLVSDAIMNRLSKLIRDSGFMDLKDSYGAPKDHHSYPYIITAQRGKHIKSVTFNSSPFFQEAPPAFKKIEVFLKKTATDLLKQN